MNALLSLFETLITIYLWIVIIYVVGSWLVRFNVLNAQTPAVASILSTLRGLVEPALEPIRRLLSRLGLGNLGGVDISPIVLVLGLVFAKDLVHLDIKPALN